MEQTTLEIEADVYIDIDTHTAYDRKYASVMIDLLGEQRKEAFPLEGHFFRMCNKKLTQIGICSENYQYKIDAVYSGSTDTIVLQELSRDDITTIKERDLEDHKKLVEERDVVWERSETLEEDEL